MNLIMELGEDYYCYLCCN